MSLNDALKVLKDHADAFRSKTGVTSKLDVVEMTKLLDDLKWGKENLLKGTSDQYRDVKVNVLYASTSTRYRFPIGKLAGQKVTYAVKMIKPVGTDIFAEIVQNDANGNWLSSKHSFQVADAGEFLLTVTDTLKASDGYVDVHVFARGVDTIKLKDERLYIGAEPGVWTPNPADKLGGS